MKSDIISTMNTVLCVDPDQNVLEDLKLTLEANGFQTITSDNTGKAMEWLAHNPPALIITEIIFPDLEPEKIVRNFLKISPNSVIIIYTNQKERRVGSDRRLDKLFEFINKPVSATVLIGHLKRAAIFGLKRIELKDFVEETRKRINQQLEWSIWEDNTSIKNKINYSESILESIRHAISQGNGIGSLISLTEMVIMDKKDAEENRYSVSSNIIDALQEPLDSVRQWMESMENLPHALNKKYIQENQDQRQITESVNKVVGELEDFRKIKNHTITVEPLEFIFPILAGKDVIEFALKELITNAFKFSPENSDILIRAHRSGNSYSILVINDIQPMEGSITGIPREFENKIFEPFFRLCNVNDDRYHKDTFGMGTGLTTILHAVFQTGGRLYIYESSDPAHANKDSRIVAEMIFPIASESVDFPG